MDKDIKISEKLKVRALTRKFLPKLLGVIEESGYLPAQVYIDGVRGRFGEWIWNEFAPNDVVEELEIKGSLCDKLLIKIFGSRYCSPKKLSKFSRPDFKNYRDYYPTSMPDDTVGIIDMSLKSPNNCSYGALIGSMEYNVDESTILGYIYGKENIPKIQKLSKNIEEQLEKEVDLTLTQTRTFFTKLKPEASIQDVS